ncbi:MAG: hypothetical protein GY775_16575, partial [Candidatus Scalindua sp.]|nr:hypothetical protein [Candidatus Scalindua sp.]
METTTQKEKKEKKAVTSKMKNYLKETISKTIDAVLNKETETEQVKNLEIDIEKKKIGINKYSYKLKLGEVNITDEDIQSLEIGQDVTDGIITLAMKLLEEAFDTIIKRDRIRLLSPNLTYLLQRGNKIDVMEEKKNLKINESEWVLYPINNKTDVNEINGGTHWSLLLYSKKDRTYYHFDPIQSMNESHAKHMILNTLDYDTFEKGLPNYVEMKCERQTNGHDCGPYIMMYMAAIIENIRNGNDINDIKNFNINPKVPLCKGATDKREWLKKTIEHKLKENEVKDALIRNVNKEEKSENDEKSKNDVNDTPCTTTENKKPDKEDTNSKMSHHDNLHNKESRCKDNTLGKTSDREDTSKNNQNNNKNKNDEKNNDNIKECWYFRKGCRNGDSCRYIHREVCKQWKENGCCYDNRCKYEHPVKCKWFLQGESRKNNCWYLHPNRIQQKLRKNNGGPRQNHNYNQYQRTNQAQERSYWGQNQDQNFGHRQN